MGKSQTQLETVLQLFLHLRDAGMELTLKEDFRKEAFENKQNSMYYSAAVHQRYRLLGYIKIIIKFLLCCKLWYGH